CAGRRFTQRRVARVRSTSVARRYARAAFEVAQEKGDPGGWLSRLEAVAEAVSDPNLAESLRNPEIPTSQKVQAIQDAFPDLTSELGNLIQLLVERDRIDLLPGIATAFSEYLDAELGRTEAQVTSARSLTGDELRAIQDHLAARTGRTVKLSTAVDERLIGGVVIRVGDEL